jgi:hypothetical protein
MTGRFGPKPNSRQVAAETRVRLATLRSQMPLAHLTKAIGVGEATLIRAAAGALLSPGCALLIETRAAELSATPQKAEAV